MSTRPKGHDWQPEQDEVLKPMWAKGISAAVCAATINQKFKLTLSRSAIIGRCHRQGFKGVGRTGVYPRVGRSKPAASRPRRNAGFQFTTPQMIPRPPVDVAKRIMAFAANGDGCRWIEGDDGVACGATVGHGPYCLEHGARAYKR